MAKKNNTILKDAAILFAITLISGLLLGLVNDFTAEVIARNKELETLKVYQSVFEGAASFEENAQINAQVAEFDALYEQSGKDFGVVSVDLVLEAKDAYGQVLGYLVTATSQDGYGGAITVNIGVDNEGATTGLGLLEINESAGLGDNAKKPEWLAQYKGKTVEEFEVTKQGASAENQIDAISGATITSKAVTGAVNAALFFLNNSVLQ